MNKKQVGAVAAIAAAGVGTVAVAPNAGATSFDPSCNGSTGWTAVNQIRTTTTNCKTQAYSNGSWSPVLYGAGYITSNYQITDWKTYP